MDPNENKKWDLRWYDWLGFAVPTIFIVSLGLESAFGPAPGIDVSETEYADEGCS